MEAKLSQVLSNKKKVELELGGLAKELADM